MLRILLSASRCEAILDNTLRRGQFWVLITLQHVAPCYDKLLPPPWIFGDGALTDERVYVHLTCGGTSTCGVI
jgi:hypothetical protein